MTPSAPQPRLTVVVPAYNVAPWLEQCIQSIRQQSLTDLEIIVVDDGSTDATGELLEAWVAEEPRLKVLHQPNAGQSAARNRALELVRSPYFTFVDGDDYLSPEVLEEAVALLESEPELGLVEFGFVEEYPDGRRQPQLHSSLRYTSLEAVRSLALSAEVSGMPWGKVYRSCMAADLRFPEGRIFEDTPFVLEALMRTTAYAYLPSCGYHYRVMRSGSSTEHWNGRLCHLFENVLELRERLIERDSPYRPLVNELLLRRLIIFVLWADRHRAEQPELLALLLPYTRSLRGEPLAPGGWGIRLRNQLFLRAPRLFLGIKRLLPTPQYS